MEQNKIDKYADMIDMPHPISKKHASMPRKDRAAQFAPFAALTGHKEAIHKKERMIMQKKILDETEKMRINEVLQEIMIQIKNRPLIKVIYFEADRLKEGGTYNTIHKKIKAIDDINHVLVFDDYTKLSLEDICEIAIGADEKNM